MTSTESPQVPSDAPEPLPAKVDLGPVRIAVTDLGRSAAFYEEVIGLRVRDRGAEAVALGDADQDLLYLELEAGAATPPAGAGMHHFAINPDTRFEFGRMAQRAQQTGTPLWRAADHVTHEALYIEDPDRHIVEIAWDAPRELWGDVRTVGYTPESLPLDVDALIASVADTPITSPYAQDIRIGHLHLIVGDVPRAAVFYRDVLGFDLVSTIEIAMFLAAGDYHHHVAVNGERGAVGPVSTETVGLREWSILLPADARAALEERAGRDGARTETRDDALTIYDPWGIPLSVLPAA